MQNSGQKVNILRSETWLEQEIDEEGKKPNALIQTSGKNETCSNFQEIKDQTSKEVEGDQEINKKGDT